MMVRVKAGESWSGIWMSSGSLAVSSGEWTRYVSSSSTSMDTSSCGREGIGSGVTEAVGDAGDSQEGFAEASDMREGSR